MSLIAEGRGRAAHPPGRFASGLDEAEKRKNETPVSQRNEMFRAARLKLLKSLLTPNQ
jgi:hypothetical protein